MEVGKALEATKTYGVETVMLFMVAAFLAWLIVYVLNQNAKREERLAGIIEKELAKLEQADSIQKQEHGRIIEGLTRIEHKLGSPA